MAHVIGFPVQPVFHSMTGRVNITVTRFESKFIPKGIPPAPSVAEWPQALNAKELDVCCGGCTVTMVQVVKQRTSAS